MDHTKATAPTSIDTPLAAAWRAWIDDPADAGTRVERLQLALGADITPAQLLKHRDRSTGMEAAA